MAAQAPMQSKSPALVEQDILKPHHDNDKPDIKGQVWTDMAREKNLPRLSCRGSGEPSRKSRPVKSEDSIIGALCIWVVDHQIGIAVNLLLLLALTHMCFPRARRHTRKFFDLSYYDPASRRYTLGWDDLFMVLHWIVVFTGLRVAVMDYILVPLAQSRGITKKKERVRFAEQAWILTYAGAFWSLGMYIMYTSDYWLNIKQVWANWPDREMDGIAKWYYLVQFSFWLQQILVVNIEERRKDYAQMFTHHIVTCALMLSSYGYHQTRVGNVILCTMDAVDIILPLAKLLKYLNYQVACDIAFGVFMVVWFITRHILFLIVTYSVYADTRRMINFGCYWGSNRNLHGPIDAPDSFDHLTQPFRDPAGLVCWTSSVMWTFVSMLIFLQVILLIWFGMIIRVAMKVIKGEEAVDTRSDGEEEEDEHQLDKKQDYEAAKIDAPPLEEEVGVEAIDLSRRKTSPGRHYRKGAAASGVTLHSDRKELLGRIGCDKGS